MMKILCYRNSNDFYFESIISCLSKINNSKFQVGYLSGEVNNKEINEFAPDVIIHNLPNVDKFPSIHNAISININETDHSNSFSFNKEGKNKLKPFVNLKDSTVLSKDVQKFTSDVVYIGSPSVFKSLCDFLTNPHNNIHFKFFTHVPHNINGYCGMCDSFDYFRLYKYSKACLAKKEDIQRIMDIVVSDGNPILFTGSNHDECVDLIKETIANNTKYSIEGYNKQDIIKNDTAFDRLAYIFKTVGLIKLSEEIIKTKNIHWNTK